MGRARANAGIAARAAQRHKSKELAGTHTASVATSAPSAASKACLEHAHIAVSSTELWELIHHELDVRERCRAFPLTFMMWLTFIFVSVAHRNVGTAHSIQSAVDQIMKSSPLVSASSTSLACYYGANERRLKSSGGGSGGGARKPDEQVSVITGESFETLSSLEAVFVWMQTVAVPILWKDGGRVSNFYKVVGGMHLQLQRAAEIPCKTNEKLHSLYGKPCASDEKDRASSAEVWLDLQQPEGQVANRISQLCQTGWTSGRTLNVKARSVLYNGELTYLVVITLSFDHVRTGEIQPEIKICTLGKFYGSALAYIGDIIWGLTMCAFVWEEHTKVQTAARKGRSKLVEHLSSWWTMLNGACIVSFIGICGFWIYFSMALPDLGKRIHAERGRLDSLAQIYDRSSKLCKQQHWNELCMFWYSMLLLVKFFQVFKANPRLDVIVITLKQSALELAHFCLAFALVFCTYALGGNLLFGTSISQWANLERAAGSTFRALVGDFAFEEMHAVAPVSSQVWFWSFMVLMGLLMLNMLLAIVLDVYCSVKDQSKRSESLFEDAVALWSDIRHKLPKGLQGDSASHAAFESSPTMGKKQHTVSLGGLQNFIVSVEQAIDAGEDSVITLDEIVQLGIRRDRALKLVGNATTRHLNKNTGQDEGSLEGLFDAQQADPFLLDDHMSSLERELQVMERERELAHLRFSQSFLSLRDKYAQQARNINKRRRK